jgi:AmmeMemoRadiSam system protein B
MSRCPAVAGSFYENSAAGLQSQVASLLKPDATARTAIGLIAPHAGFEYSGSVAGLVYSGVRVPETAVILGPNHTGLGHAAAVGLGGPWEIPTGPVDVDTDLAQALLAACPDLEADDTAHAEDHAIEVQLPFLRHRNPGVRIVPVCFRTMSFADCETVGRRLAEVVADRLDRTLLVASSDMNHHEPKRVAARKDRMALDRIAALDPRGLYSVVIEHHVTMCGFVPAVVMLVAALALGARGAEVVAYANSGDADGDESSVVGYAGVVVTREKPRRTLRSVD